ncbi:uncharacterized protein LOC142802802 [Rhipicephalus microplus]|uniref:uncharacterized protein LOC142802802 n=1 Tax=Rhipicephalus microplus TaxID=6941 RepID=UPI003F6B7316
MADTILRELDFQPSSVTFYTDSKVVLGYIHNKTRRFYVYVANRVQRIRASTRPGQWKYVCTEENPADHATRPIPAAQLEKTNWFSGPDFLSQPQGEASSSCFKLIDPNEDEEVGPEVRTFVTKTNQRQQLGAERFSKFSSWSSLTRAVAGIIRVARRAKSSPPEEMDLVDLLY